MNDYGEQLFGQWSQPAATKSLDRESSNEVIWQLDLPADATRARAAVLEQRAVLRRDQAELEQAFARLSTFVDQWEPGQPEQTKSLDPEPSPESALANALSAIGAPQTKGLFDPLDQARDEFNQFVQRVQELVSGYARIETSQDGALLAQTAVSWTGDFKTAWREAATIEQIELHRHNVRQALVRRAMLMKLLAVISTGAARIVIRLATPGAQLLVIPAVWQFIKDVVQQIQALSAAQTA